MFHINNEKDHTDRQTIQTDRFNTSSVVAEFMRSTHTQIRPKFLPEASLVEGVGDGWDWVIVADLHLTILMSYSIFLPEIETESISHLVRSFNKI